MCDALCLHVCMFGVYACVYIWYVCVCVYVFLLSHLYWVYVFILVGWLTLLRHLCICAVLARAVTQNLNVLLMNRLKYLTKIHVGELPFSHSLPDFLAPLPALGATIVIAMGLQARRFTINILNTVILMLLLFCLVVGLFRIDFKRWNEPQMYFAGGASGVRTWLV